MFFVQLSHCDVLYYLSTDTHSRGRPHHSFSPPLWSEPTLVLPPLWSHTHFHTSLVSPVPNVSLTFPVLHHSPLLKAALRLGFSSPSSNRIHMWVWPRSHPVTTPWRPVLKWWTTSFTQNTMTHCLRLPAIFQKNWGSFLKQAAMHKTLSPIFRQTKYIYI